MKIETPLENLWVEHVTEISAPPPTGVTMKFAKYQFFAGYMAAVAHLEKLGHLRKTSRTTEFIDTILIESIERRKNDTTQSI